MPHARMLACFVAATLGASALTGCTGTSKLASNSLGGWFQKKPSIPEPPPLQVPDKLRDERTLTLRYASWMIANGSLQEASQKYHELLQKNSKDAEAIIGLARIDELNGELPKAEQGYRRAVELGPEVPGPQIALGRFLAGQKRWGEAADAFNRAVIANPCDRQARSELATALVYNGDVDGALSHFVVTDDNATAHYRVAVILKEEGRLGEAEQQLRIALTKNPKLMDARRLLAETAQQGRPQADMSIVPAVHSTQSPPPAVTPAGGRGAVTTQVSRPVGNGHSISG